MTKDEHVVELIHENTLKLLKEVGLEFHSENALQTLREGGVRVEGRRAYFNEKQVMDAIDAATKDFTVYARNPKYNVHVNTEDLYVMPGYGSPSVCEADGTVRSAVMDDFLKLAELVQVSELFSINGGILAQPSDIPAEISAEAMVYATLCRSDKALFSVCGGGVQASRIMKMLEIVFGDIHDWPCSFNLISTLSPMAVPTNAIETMDICAEYGQPLVIGPGPMAGGTGPVSLAGNTSLCNAEILGTNVYAQMIHPGVPVIYCFAATVSDLNNMNPYNSGPGFLKEAKYGAMLAKKYGFACRSGGGMSDASGFTAQAGVESAMNLFHSFECKANFVMHAAGSLHSFGTVSYEKFILDMETIDRLRYYSSDLDVEEEALAFDAIREAVEEGENFILSEHTLERMRKDPWTPMISLHNKSHGDPNQELIASAQKKIAALLENYHRPALEQEKRSRLDELMRKVGLSESEIARI